MSKASDWQSNEFFKRPKNLWVVVTVIVASLVIMVGTSMWSKSGCETKSVLVPSDTKKYFEIKELGIKFPVDADIADDLIYRVENRKNGGQTAYIATEEFNALNEHCAKSAIMAVGKNPGNSTDAVYGKYYQNRKVKQFDDYFIYFSGSQAPCAPIGEYEKYKLIGPKIYAGSDFVVEINQ